jgi:ATP-dependent DNA ligase
MWYRRPRRQRSCRYPHLHCAGRFGGPLALSKVHWVRPELVAEITYRGWTDEPLLRHTVFAGLREDKPAREARRDVASRP